MLNQIQLFALSPLILLGSTATLLMLAIAFRRHHGWNATFAVTGLNLALLATLMVWALVAQEGAIAVTQLIVMDGYACFFICLLLILTLGCCTLSHTYLRYFSDQREEMYLLMLLSLIGAVVLVSSMHFASLFIGMELLSVPLYGLAAYQRKHAKSLEAGVKYLVLSTTASAFMLFGMALIYAQSGQLLIPEVARYLMAHQDQMPLMMITGCVLILTALAFKLSLAPFHLWTPDVYEGAPAPTSAYLATVAKIAVAAALLRWVGWTPIFLNPDLHMLLMLLAGLSILIGNLLALRQNNLKRLLAYSSVGHFGYLVAALAAFNFATLEACLTYLAVYGLASLAAFGVIAVVTASRETDTAQSADADSLPAFRGLFWQQPWLAVVLTIALLSLAGMPMTAGFIGKFYVILAMANASLWWLLAVLVIGSGIGLYYYLRVISTLFLREPGMARLRPPFNWSRTACGAMLLVCVALIMLLGVYPQPLFDWIGIAGIG